MRGNISGLIMALWIKLAFPIKVIFRVPIRYLDGEEVSLRSGQKEGFFLPLTLLFFRRKQLCQINKSTKTQKPPKQKTRPLPMGKNKRRAKKI